MAAGFLAAFFAAAFLAGAFFAVAITILLDQVAKSTDLLEQAGDSPPSAVLERRPDAMNGVVGNAMALLGDASRPAHRS
ncbi:MAG TPA: hypothetical protein VNV16_05550 [Methylibium sp.]|nr:hypothetical protein [Methylibium sp.]